MTSPPIDMNKELQIKSNAMSRNKRIDRRFDTLELIVERSISLLGKSKQLFLELFLVIHLVIDLAIVLIYVLSK